MTDFLLKPIGAVFSPVKQRNEMPPLGVASGVEVFPEFAPALLRLEKHSHLWVLAWLDHTGREALQVTPRGVRDQGAGGLHGVFAVRSPTRPNPIGLTAARITARDRLRIHFDRLDFIDATPVLDLKPYFVTRDMIFSAANRQIGRPASIEALEAALAMQVEMFCGCITPDMQAAIRICARFRAEVLDFTDPEAYRVTVPLARPEVIDAVMAMTRVHFSDQSLLLGDQDAIVFHHAGASFSYPLY